MYSEEDLDNAVQQGILRQEDVNALRQHRSQTTLQATADQESFRLLTGFNDIFVSIAGALFFVSLFVLGANYDKALATILTAAAAWLFAEIFVRKQRMALPAILSLVFFVASAFALPLAFFVTPTTTVLLMCALFSTIAAYVHWQRFRVPITVAASTVGILTATVGIIINRFPGLIEHKLTILFIAGILVFLFAMYWDSRDLARRKRSSDVAFWLHLLAAPLIVHPVFQQFAPLGGAQDVNTAILVSLVYLILAVISIIIDRRAIMVSALIYVLYTFGHLMQSWSVGYGLALAGFIISSSLLVLSAYWSPLRAILVSHLPANMQRNLPVTLVR